MSVAVAVEVGASNVGTWFPDNLWILDPLQMTITPTPPTEEWREYRQDFDREHQSTMAAAASRHEQTVADFDDRWAQIRAAYETDAAAILGEASDAEVLLERYPEFLRYHSKPSAVVAAARPEPMALSQSEAVEHSATAIAEQKRGFMGWVAGKLGVRATAQSAEAQPRASLLKRTAIAFGSVVKNVLVLPELTDEFPTFGQVIEAHPLARPQPERRLRAIGRAVVA